MVKILCAGGLSELCVLSRQPLCIVPDLCVLSRSGLCIVSKILCIVPLLGKNIRKLVIRKTEGLGNPIIKPDDLRSQVGRMFPAGGKDANLWTHGKEVA
jgi:hypothetical protein